MLVLHIENDEQTIQYVQSVLGREDIRVTATADVAEGIHYACDCGFDAIILEIDIDRINGFDAIAVFRREGVRTPILVLSKLSDIGQKVKAFDLGADDYLTKPFHGDELAARVRALIRRSYGLVESAVTVGAVTVDVTRKTVAVNDKPVRLTSSEYKIIEALAYHARRVVSDSRIREHLYDDDVKDPDSNIVQVLIGRLRKKFADAGADGHIINVRALGYKLAEPEEVSKERPAEVVEKPPSVAAPTPPGPAPAKQPEKPKPSDDMLIVDFSS